MTESVLSEFPHKRKVKSDFVEVFRTGEIMKFRSKLPIILEEDSIMEAITENQCVIICGETGCGKTTQVPQFLYEAGYSSPTVSSYKKGIIGVTEPRRIAAIAMASRIAYELNLSSRLVSYQIRYEGNVTEETRIKFLTDGVLLKEIENDFLLSKYSVIVIDEAHERSLHTDILIGLLSRIVPLRQQRGNPLKWVIMSATLCVEQFVENRLLFKSPPPVMKVNARQFPVSLHYCKRTPTDYIRSAFKRVCRIHHSQTHGHILVFVTSQKEVKYLCRLISQKFKPKNMDFNKKKKSKVIKNISEEEPISSPADDQLSDSPVNEIELNESDDSINLEGESDCELYFTNPSCHKDMPPIRVYPLYAMLSRDLQNKVFEELEYGYRKCIVATNVAETSITIPGVKYIVDTGKVKNKYFDKLTGAEKYEVSWCSKASANQRMGRAGRTESGHCYRLYSTAVFQYDLPDFTEPDILKQSLQNIVLQMKCMNIGNIEKFPFPTIPSAYDIKQAEKVLLNLKALESCKTNKGLISSKVTTLGRQVNTIPLMPRYSRMIIDSLSHSCQSNMILICSTLSVREFFSEDICFNNTDDKEEDLKPTSMTNSYKIRNQLWGDKGYRRKLGDIMVILNAVGACWKSKDVVSFCLSYGIRCKALDEVRKLIKLISNQVCALKSQTIPIEDGFKQPSYDDVEHIRKIFVACFHDQIARKLPVAKDQKGKINHLYKCAIIESPLRIHPSSILFGKKPKYVLFLELVDAKYLYMKKLLEVDENWIEQ